MAMENGPLKMYSLYEHGIFQPAMLNYRRVQLLLLWYQIITLKRTYRNPLLFAERGFQLRTASHGNPKQEEKIPGPTMPVRYDMTLPGVTCLKPWSSCCKTPYIVRNDWIFVHGIRVLSNEKSWNLAWKPPMAPICQTKGDVAVHFGPLHGRLAKDKLELNITVLTSTRKPAEDEFSF